jgi:hypothetical protein
MKAKILWPLLLVLTFATATTVAAKTYRLTGTELSPAATGEINTNIDRNGNVEVDLKAEHLAQPTALRSPGEMYVVWFQEPGKPATNQGQLRVNDDLNAELKATTPARHFEVIVTAERDVAATMPSSAVVLRATVQE